MIIVKIMHTVGTKIKRGVMYSRSVDGQDQLIMGYDPADISTSTDTEVTRP